MRSIELVLPGESRFMHLARLMASGVAGTFGLPLELVEDVRIAVDELCATLIEVGEGHPIRLAFQSNTDALTVTGIGNANAHWPDPDRLALSHQMLDVLTESHEFTQTESEAVFTVVIRYAPAGKG